MAKCERLRVWLLLSSFITLTSTQFRNRDRFYDDFRQDDERPPQRRQPPPPIKNINPCHLNHHRVITNEPRRSYNYRFGSGSLREQALCDRDLIPGWYRFNSLAGDTIPTSCPGVNYCGTRAPVWMKGSIPSTDEGVVKVAGCVSVQGKCCTTQIPMLVRNCSDFIVYHLQPTPACPSAYCAGYEVPCPAGLTSDNGYTPCHFPVDLLETKVSSGLSKDGAQVQFFCDITLGGHVVPESVALEVEWLADDETIQTETFGLLQQHKGVLKEDKWSIGQILQCKARAKHTTINTFTSAVISPPYNTGIKVLSPPNLAATEGADPVYIELQSKVPILCPKKKKPAKTGKKKEEEQEEEEEEECCVTLELSVRGPISPPRCSSGSPFDLVVLNTCGYKICGDEWNITHRIPVWAINDGLFGKYEDHDVSVMVDLRVDEKSPPRWQDVSIPSQEVHIHPADINQRCTIDEYITTFDGVTYRNPLEGIFVLYRHATLPYEVQIQLKKCNQRALCNCAVAIRFGDVMLAAEICTLGKMRFWSYTADGSYIEPSKISHLPQIIRIDEGRSFQIQLPTGTRINLGPNLRFVSIQASLMDEDKTSGLCSTLDKDDTNDFTTFKGQIVCPANKTVALACEDYAKSWRLLSEQSLFQGSFSNDGHLEDDGENHLDDSLHPGYCSCSGLKKPKSAQLRPKSKNQYSSYPYEEFQPEEQQEEESDASKCYSSQCVDPRGIDVTMQLLELVLDEEFSDEDNTINLKAEPGRLTPVFYGASKQDLILRNNGQLSDDDAEVYCRGMIEGMPATKLCRDIAHVDVETHIKTCKHELMHSKTTIWSMDALEQLRWDCRDQVYHNLTIWEPQLGRQHGTPPLAILSSLCLNNCTDNGACENGHCICHRGFSGSDCSVNIREAPIITAIAHKGICDIRKKPCSEILIWGERFAEHENIKCHFDIYRTQSLKSIPTLSGTVITNGRLLTFQSLICDIPDLPIHDAKITSFYIPGEGLDKTRALLRVRVTYGTESSPSESHDFAIFDSLCWICESPLSCTPQPSQSCNVLSEPFGSTDPFQPTQSFSNPTLGFSPSNGRLQFSPDSSGGFTPATVASGVLLHGSHPQLHPQLSNPCHQTKDSGPCKTDNLRYFYDTSASKCRPFIYGGCQGNSNNFQTEQDCLSICTVQPSASFVSDTPTHGVASPSQQLGHLTSLNAALFQTTPKVPQKCLLGNNPGSCHEETVRYYYDSLMKKCRPFIYGGCNGNENNFPTKDECVQECERLT